MDFKALKIVLIPFKKNIFRNNKLPISIDCGVLFTKVLFVHKDSISQLYDSNIDWITVHYGLFKNVDFKLGIRWIQRNGILTNDTSGVIHITGISGYDQTASLESILQLKCEYINETSSLINGLKIGIEEFGIDHLIAPRVECENMGDCNSVANDKIYGKLTKQAMGDFPNNVGNSALKYPCLIQVVESVSKFIFFDKFGKAEVLQCQSLRMEIILGLGKCLLDTNNYDEIIALAAKGDRSNVDTQTKDVLPNPKDTPYGIFPPDMPLFPFGKCVDLNVNIADFAKEDIAASIIAFYCMLIVNECLHGCRMKEVTSVYLIGDIFRCDTYQKEIRRYLSIFPPLFELEILDFDHVRCLAAIIYEKESLAK